MKRNFSGILFLLFIAACSPVRQISIETYNPAGLTFPAEVKTVLIMDNAVPQQNVPFESSLRNWKDSADAVADSTTGDFCRALGRLIAESPYFEDVRLYEGFYRADSLYSFDGRLTEEEVNQLCEEQASDAIISLDQLLFHVKEYAPLPEDFDIITEVEVSGVLRTCLPDRATPFSTIYISDTVSFRINPYESEYDLFTPSGRETVLRDAAKEAARIYYTCFVPYWSADARWYYISPNSRWKEATAYAVSGKWEEAAAVWNDLYAKTASRKSKGRLASNLALCAELTGDLTQAVSWATKAHRHFLDHSNEENQTVKTQKKYINVLEYRIRAEKKLFLQIQ
jgi:hypothetical protein